MISRFPSRKRARGLKNPRTVGSIPPLDDNASKFNNLERAIGAIMFPTDNAVTPGRVMTMFEEVGAPRANEHQKPWKEREINQPSGKTPRLERYNSREVYPSKERSRSVSVLRLRYHQYDTTAGGLNAHRCSSNQAAIRFGFTSCTNSDKEPSCFPSTARSTLYSPNRGSFSCWRLKIELAVRYWAPGGRITLSCISTACNISRPSASPNLNFMRWMPSSIGSNFNDVTTAHAGCTVGVCGE